MLIKNYLSSSRKFNKLTKEVNTTNKNKLDTSTSMSIAINNRNEMNKSNKMEHESDRELGADLIANMDCNYDNLNNLNENQTTKQIEKQDDKLNMNYENKTKMINSNNNTILNNQHSSPNFLYTLTNIHPTIKRRFSETYYKSVEHHKRPRLVKKCGELNIHMGNVPKHKRRLMSDFFNTILDIKWRWHFVIFILSFLVSWFLFATIWYSIAYFHGDLNPENRNGSHTDLNQNYTYDLSINLNKTISNHLLNLNELEHVDILNTSILLIDHVIKKIHPKHLDLEKSFDIDPLNSTFTDFLTYRKYKREQSAKEDKKHMPCVHGIHDFTSALLYSVETQHTIGYGLRYITEECSFAIVFLMLQSCFGIFVQGLVAGVVFAKISRPSKRKRTIIFSHNAVVSERDGKLSFMFKIGNIRISQLSDARLKLLMIKSRRTIEGEFIPFQSYEMKVGHNWSGNDSVFFPWPKTVEHVIDEDSPFYEMCKHVLNKNQIELSTSTSSSSSGLSTPPTYPLMESEYKQEDYEIVVILEGNIETTGASCHIRTSYLPQEILFGYRFVPIYPKFTDFEYLFDYSKFDQVEPFNFNLMHLNKAHLNRELNYVCDARNEAKNYQLTFQNTVNNNQNKTNNFKYLKEKKPVSIMSFLNNFKTQNNNNLNKDDDIEDGKESPKCKNESYMNTLTTLMADSKSDIKQNENTSADVSKNGRFTVCPVNESKVDEGKYKQIYTNINNSNKQISNRYSIKKINNNQTNHYRANSLPPIHSASLLEELESDAKVFFKNNRKESTQKENFYIN